MTKVFEFPILFDKLKTDVGDLAGLKTRYTTGLCISVLRSASCVTAMLNELDFPHFDVVFDRYEDDF